LLQRAIIDNPPAVIRDGGVIREGYDSELDDLQNISENAGQYLIDLEYRERERTGLSTLKVGYNRVHGYYIELPQLGSATCREFRRVLFRSPAAAGHHRQSPGGDPRWRGDPRRVRQRAGRPAEHQRERRPVPDRSGEPRTRAHRSVDPQGRLQPGAWLLYRTV